MIRCVIFDMGDVLVQFQPYSLFALLDRHSARRKYVSAETFFHGQIYYDYEAGRLNNKEFYQSAVHELGLRGLSQEAFFVAFAGVLHPDFEMLKIKQRLVEGGVKLALLTNNTPFFMEVIPHRWPTVLSLFEVVISSHEVGLLKPDPAIYAALMERLARHNLAPSECLFVDDHLENVEVFRKMGGLGYLYDASRGEWGANPEVVASERELFGSALVRLGLIQ